MAVSSRIYSHVFSYVLTAIPQSASSDLLSDTIKVMLATSSHTISRLTHTVYGDVSANEASGTGYTTGGATLGSKTYSTSSLTTTFDAADTVWTTVSLTSAASAHVYDTITGVPLICYQDFGGAQTTNAADFAIIWNASGLFSLSVT